jgi:hypothetical protein
MGNPPDVKSLFPEFFLPIMNLEKKNFFQDVKNWKKINKKSESLSKN